MTDTKYKPDWSELTINLQALTRQLTDNLNQNDNKAAFATSVDLVTVSIKLQQITWEGLKK